MIAYCHSGGRSAMAVELLRAAGYDARNYVGSWHEWAADPSCRSSRAAPLSRLRSRGTPPQTAAVPVPPAEQRVRSPRTAGGSGSSDAPSTNQWSSMWRVTSGWNCTPQVRLAQTVGLARGVVVGEQLRAVRELEAVVVPLEGVDPLRQHADDRIVPAGVVESTSCQPTSARGAGPTRAPDRAGDQLRAEADAEERDLARDRPADELGLIGEPGVLGVLVRVHGAAEDHDRVVALRRVGRGPRRP